MSVLVDTICEVCHVNVVAVTPDELIDLDFCPTCKECEAAFGEVTGE